MAILKTEFRHLKGVRENAKHASGGVFRELMPGGTLLIQVTSATNPTATPLIKFAMTYVRCYPDTRGESRRIWGKAWPYIIEGEDLYELQKPFAIRSIQVTRTNYGQGAIRFAYVRNEDVDAIMAAGLLQPKA